MKLTISGLKGKEYKEQKEKDILWANEIKNRDGWCCVICGSKYAPNAHHIVPRENKEYRHILDNGITLCTKHHKFSRVLSAHNNPLAFFMWLEKYRYLEYMVARARNIQIARGEASL